MIPSLTTSRRTAAQIRASLPVSLIDLYLKQRARRYVHMDAQSVGKYAQTHHVHEAVKRPDFDFNWSGKNQASVARLTIDGFEVMAKIVNDEDYTPWDDDGRGTFYRYEVPGSVPSGMQYDSNGKYIGEQGHSHYQYNYEFDCLPWYLPGESMAALLKYYRAAGYSRGVAYEMAAMDFHTRRRDAIKTQEGDWAAYGLEAIVYWEGEEVGQASCWGFELSANAAPSRDPYIISSMWEEIDEALSIAKAAIAPRVAEATAITIE